MISLTFDPTGQKPVASGQFRNGVHAVSGTVRLFERNGQQTLVFTSFRSDAGPDLRIYLATDTRAIAFTEVSLLTATGNFFVTVPAGVLPAHQLHARRQGPFPPPAGSTGKLMCPAGSPTRC